MKVERQTLRSWRRWARPQSERLLGGVCASIGRRWSVDPWLVRLAFAVLALAQGIGVVVYVFAWLVMPREGETPRGPERLGEIASSRMEHAFEELRASGRALRAGFDDLTVRPWPRPVSRRFVAFGLVALGAIALMASLGWFAWLDVPRGLALTAIVVGVGVLFTVRPQDGKDDR